MWMVNSKYMCEEHLCLEYEFIHEVSDYLCAPVQFCGYERYKEEVLKGYIEMRSMRSRFEELEEELNQRQIAYKRYTKPKKTWYFLGNIDKEKAQKELKALCKQCAARMERLVNWTCPKRTFDSTLNKKSWKKSRVLIPPVKPQEELIEGGFQRNLDVLNSNSLIQDLQMQLEVSVTEDIMKVMADLYAKKNPKVVGKETEKVVSFEKLKRKFSFEEE